MTRREALGGLLLLEKSFVYREYEIEEAAASNIHSSSICSLQKKAFVNDPRLRYCLTTSNFMDPTSKSTALAMVAEISFPEHDPTRILGDSSWGCENIQIGQKPRMKNTHNGGRDYYTSQKLKIAPVVFKCEGIET